MSLVVQGDTGLVIKCREVEDQEWSVIASAGMESGTNLMPTSTTDLTNWYHAKSDQSENAKAQQQEANAYTDVTSSKASYMIKRTFGIRSATSVPIEDVMLAVEDVKATSKTAQSESLDKSIRIGVKVGEAFYIFAPRADAASPLTEGNFTLKAYYDMVTTTEGETTTQAPKEVTEYLAAAKDSHNFTLAGDKVPADDTGIDVEIYAWFEGEDGNCMSNNITANLDTMNVAVKFTTVAA